MWSITFMVEERPLLIYSIAAGSLLGVSVWGRGCGSMVDLPGMHKAHSQQNTHILSFSLSLPPSPHSSLVELE